MLLALANPAYSQHKLVIDDRAGISSEVTVATLRTRLAADSIELTNILDITRRCDYWMASISEENRDLTITVRDCNDRIAGKRNLGTKIFQASDQEKALLIYFAFADVLSNPYQEDQIPEKEKEAAAEDATLPAEIGQVDPEQHQTRYFFAPTSYNLEKGDLYYNTLYFFLHDVQYGISDQFSMGVGTTVAGFPFYITPKLTFPIDAVSSFAVGDLLMVGTWGASFFGNLLYGTYTRGGAYNNFTLGGGYLYTSEGDLTMQTNAPVLNFSWLMQVSDHIYFLSENYASQLKSKQTAYFDSYNQVTGEYTYYNESFRQNMFFIYGMAGFRFINRSRDIVSWQFGLTYLYRSFGDVPYKYSQPNWYVSAERGGRFITFPVIGYARKFAMKY